MSAKKWLQTIGIVLMVSAFYNSKSRVAFHFDKWELIVGALIFASTFLTRKRDGDGSSNSNES